MAQRSTPAAVNAAAICILLAFALSLLGPWTLLFYGPLYLAAFILGIVGCAQGYPGNGIAAILLSLLLPFATLLYQIFSFGQDLYP